MWWTECYFCDVFCAFDSNEKKASLKASVCFLKVFLELFMKNPISEKSGNLSGVNYKQVISIIWMGNQKIDSGS